MSRYLSQALGVNEARFAQALMALERRSGHPNQDIRLSSTLMLGVRKKLEELNLDPNDTTSEELYYSLNHLLKTQDKLVTKKLRHLAATKVNAEANINDGLNQLIKDLNLKQSCFALKHSVLRRQLKLSPPKKVMKALSYRSVDSMLKLEPIPLILMAVNFYESEAYVSKLYTSYARYTPSDFELRPISFIFPKSKKWNDILSTIHQKSGLTMITSYELASIILMALKNELKPGYLSLVLSSLISEVSITLAVSNCLRLEQVNKKFGNQLQKIAEHEPYFKFNHLDQPVSWRSLQQLIYDLNLEINLPHINSQDLKPEKLLNKLSDIFEDYKFWQGNDHLGLVRNSQATSFNLNDVAYNLVNDLPFNSRQLSHFRHYLNQELAKLYLSPAHISEALFNSQPEPVLAEVEA